MDNYPKPINGNDLKIYISSDMVDSLVAMVESGKKEDHDLAVSIFRNRDKKHKETQENWKKISDRLNKDGYIWGWVSRGRMGYKQTTRYGK